MKISNFQKGFTLIELLVYISLFSIVLGVAMTLFFQTRNIENEVVQEQEIDRNARTAFLEMTQTVRGASSVSSPILGATDDDLYLNSSSIHYFVNASGVMQKTESGTTRDLTSDAVSIENIAFTTRGEVGEKPTVTLSFDVRTNTLIYGQSNYKTRNFRTTVQLR